MLDQLQSIRKAVTPVVFNVYDQAENESDLPLLATTIDNRSLQEDPVNLEWVGEFFEMRPWLDEKTLQKVFKGTFAIPIDAYELTIGVDVKKIRRPGAIGAELGRFERMARAFSRGKKKLVMDTFRLNPLAYDGQNLFDTDHVHPGGKGTYSNILEPAVVDEDAPTVDELKAALHDSFARLRTIGGVIEEVINTERIRKNYVVVSHSPAYTTVFERIRTMDRIDNAENELKGTFTLLEDQKPTSGEETYFEVMYSAPNGPRPVIFVIDEEPTELKIDDGTVFKNRLRAMGLEAYYGTKPGWPQVVVQNQPNETP